MERSARETLDELSVTTLRSVRQAVAGLSGGQRQAVAVAKAVMWNSKVVILDEPTAALGVAQTRQVLDLVRRLADRGLAVVLISHNLHDVFEVADRITVLRLGQRVAVFDRHETTQQEVVHAITAGQLKHVPGMAAEVDRVSEPAVARPRARRSAVERPPADGIADTLADAWRGWCVGALETGDWGALPIFVGLAALALLFGILDEQLLHRAELREPAAADGGHHDDRDRRRLRAPDRRDRPLGRLRQRRRRRGDDAPPAPGGAELALVGRDRASRSWRRPRSASCTG